MSTFHWRTDSRLEPAGGGDDDDSNSRTLQNHNISRCVSLSLSPIFSGRCWVLRVALIEGQAQRHIMIRSELFRL